MAVRLQQTQSEVLWPCFIAADAGRRGPTFQTISRINDICLLITRHFDPVCSLYALITFCGLRAFCQIHNLFHYIGSQVRSPLPPLRPLNAKWFISKLSMSTAAAGDLPRPATPSLAGKDWHFRAARRDVLHALIALWSYRVPSFLFIWTSRSYLPLEFHYDSQYWHYESDFWIALANCEYLILRNRLNESAVVGRIIRGSGRKSLHRRKTNYKKAFSS